MTGSKAVGAGVMAVLLGAGLGAVGEHALAITNKGFQFLLAGRHAQLWALIVQHFRLVEAAGSDVVPAVTAVCQLALLRSGCAVPAAVPSDLLAFLADLGLVRLGGAQPVATSLAEQLVDARDTSQGVRDAGNVIVETNYKVYMYTDSPLQIAIMGLFARLRDRFANMIDGQLTAPSVQAALAKGISAQQIIAYLSDHAHPVMRARAAAGGQPLIPPVIEDQIHLWERDRDRLRTADGYLYQQFASEAAFSKAVQESTRISAVLYVNYPRRLLIVSPDAHPTIKAFIKASVQQ